VVAIGSGRRGRGRALTPAGVVALVLVGGFMFAFLFLARFSDRDEEVTPSTAISDLQAGAGAVAGAPVRAMEAAAGDAVAALSGADKIRRLEAENRVLRETLLAQGAQVERLKRYESLLGIEGDGRREVMAKGIAARLVADQSGVFGDARLANAGARHGVKPGSAALNEFGVVGRVAQIGARSCRILLLTDPLSRVPVVTRDGRARAILQGDQSDRPRLTVIDHPERLKEGDIVMTSGEGGVFAWGLPVGTVEKAGGGWRVRLAGWRAPLEFVRLVQFAPPDLPPPDAYVLPERPLPTLGARLPPAEPQTQSQTLTPGAAVRQRSRPAPPEAGQPQMPGPNDPLPTIAPAPAPIAPEPDADVLPSTDQ
jgi:rod shape-determining protein MreC